MADNDHNQNADESENGNVNNDAIELLKNNKTYVYLLDSEKSWIPAQILERNDTDHNVKLNIPQYKDEQSIVCDGGRSARRFEKLIVDTSTQELPLQNVDNDGNLQVVEDMVDLPFLHEAAILYNLKARHSKSLPYTRTGDIVLAVNPYKWFYDLYSDKQRNLYGKMLVWNVEDIDGDPRTQLPPHVYEASCLAYRGLLRNGDDQSILVSGESGAGKTETVKILLQDLASVQQQSRNSISMPDHKNIIVERVLDSNPLLEAFGNAQTLRNDNSSRFGKYLQLQFDRPRMGTACKLAGSKCEVYLLEKSRVTLHHPDERTYHIFYQLLAAPETTKAKIWDDLENTDNESFVYVGYSQTDTIEGKTDGERFELTSKALELIGVKEETLLELWRAICVVLQLGNLTFEPSGDGDGSQMADEDDLQGLSSLMGIPSESLTTALTIRNMKARSETFQVPLTAEKAKESADAFAKEIYAKTFLWLVRTINDATCAEKNYNQKVAGNKFGTIGLLDIFGFETFDVNRFEQLCINYANEKLQQKFTQDIFRSVQLEYEMEGIELEEITYDDNTDVLDLVEGRMGLLAFLNEECVRPKGSDKTFVHKAQSMNSDNPCFFRDKHAPPNEFGICHYAGKVVYDATNFVVKNMDTLPTDLQDCAKLSTNEIISNHLQNEAMMNPLNSSGPGGGKAKKRPKGAAAGGGAAAATKQSSYGKSRRSSNLVAETVFSKFKNQLVRLMDTLSETQTRYIRCIKPNKSKLPLTMEHVSTVDQLRCAGVVAAVTISRSAFPNRLEHLVVLERFKKLWPKGTHNAILEDTALDPDERAYKAVESLLTLALMDMEFTKQNIKFRAFVMGKSRAYFRAGALEFLEAERLKFLGRFATLIQTQVRSFVIHSHYKRHMHSILVLQTRHRQRTQRLIYEKKRSSCIRIQCMYRVVYAARAIVHLRRTIRATTIQTRWRIVRDRYAFLRKKAAIVPIQAMVRGALQRPKYRQALIDKKEEAKLENQLAALQRKLEEAEAKRVAAEKEAEERAKAAVAKYKEGEDDKQQKKDETTTAEGIEADFNQKLNEIDGLVDELKEGDEDGNHEFADARERAMSEELEKEHEITLEQQKLMDESGKMLEHLRKEVFKLRTQNQQLKTDFDLLKENNQRLMDANASAGASFAALNQHAKHLSKTNAQLESEKTAVKGQVQKLSMLQVELKEELKLKQATYVGEVQSRLQYQKALQKITDMVQDQCRDHRLVERVLEVADECEMEYMTQGEGGRVARSRDDEDGHEADLGASKSGILGYLPSFFS